MAASEHSPPPLSPSLSVSITFVSTATAAENPHARPTNGGTSLATEILPTRKRGELSYLFREKRKR
jgi:hypothetical protein